MSGTFEWNEQAGNAAENYEDFLVPGMFTPFAEKLLDDAGVGEGAKVLDVACGTGIVSRLAARRAGSGGAVTGVDMGPPMLAVAEGQPAEDGAAPITYVQGDAAQLPVGDGEFDFYTCHHGLQFFPEKAAALREAKRALRDGGTIAVGCWANTDRMPSMRVIADALEKHLGEELGAAMRSPFVLGDTDALRAVFEEAGIEADVREVEGEATFDDHANFAPKALGAGPLAGPFAAAPEEVRAAITADVAAGLEPYATPEGGVRAPTVSIVAIARV